MKKLLVPELELRTPAREAHALPPDTVARNTACVPYSHIDVPTTPNVYRGTSLHRIHALSLEHVPFEREFAECHDGKSCGPTRLPSPNARRIPRRAQPARERRQGMGMGFGSETARAGAGGQASHLPPLRVYKVPPGAQRRQRRVEQEPLDDERVPLARARDAPPTLRHPLPPPPPGASLVRAATPRDAEQNRTAQSPTLGTGRVQWRIRRSDFETGGYPLRSVANQNTHSTRLGEYHIPHPA